MSFILVVLSFNNIIDINVKVHTKLMFLTVNFYLLIKTFIQFLFNFYLNYLFILLVYNKSMNNKLTPLAKKLTNQVVFQFAAKDLLFAN